ncbi:M28 family peptidase [Carboxylicivirga sp. M1479]|uniref:M28 family peptidase n=1 Tax=Carboxylicivirga sp. M1479 TaxID=2594476 RepID=UPI001178AF66|nr:M28 family peptidase [Carboxylicivirga sp. M1479]TRX72424.1 M28 family peptidase [Carboxylicivirga sp. M1479]
MRFTLLIAFTLCFTWLKAQDEAEIIKHFHSITASEVFGYANTLSQPEFDGRLAGSPGYTKAAQWVGQHLEEWGISPAYGDSYFKSYPQDYTLVKSAGSFSVVMLDKKGNSIEKSYSFPEHYYPGSNSANGTVSGELVYIGFGITAPQHNYDDYKGIDVKGKIVMIEPGHPKPEGAIEWNDWANVAGSSIKIKNALNHGAVGVLYISKIASPGIKYQEDMIYCHIDKKVVNEFFFARNLDYTKVLEKLKSKHKAQSLALGHTITLSAETDYHADGQYANVIGIIPGTDPQLKDEVIMVGAHLDGQGNLGQLFPGALDNASGVADIMAAARALSNLPAPKRTIAFFFIGAEEKGLLGALEYAKDPLYTRDKTVCYINLDMVGNGTGLYFGGGESFPDIYKHFKQSNQQYIHRTLKTNYLNRAYKGRPRTDGMALSQEGFRALSVHCTDRVKKLYYHHPADTPETLVPEIMEDVSKWLYLSLYSLANDESVDLNEVMKPE